MGERGKKNQGIFPNFFTHKKATVYTWDVQSQAWRLPSVMSLELWAGNLKSKTTLSYVQPDWDTRVSAVEKNQANKKESKTVRKAGSNGPSPCAAPVCTQLKGVSTESA